MALSISQKASILGYKKQIVSYQLDLSRLKEKKKLRVQYYSQIIKSANSAASKASYRTNKLNELNYLSNQIDTKKKQILSCRERILQIKK